MNLKVAIITAILSEAADMTEKELEAAIKIYLKAEDIPYCERIDKVKVVSDT